MQASELIERYNTGKRDFRGVDLSGVDLSGVDLIGVDLSGVDLSYANLRGAHLSCANLSYANLSDANLSGAHLSYADLIGAHLSYANLSGANLRGANLRGAHLSGVDLSYANLSYANLSGAHLSYADLRGADLSGAKDDLMAKCDLVPGEVAGLLATLEAGRVDGSVYEGECACFVGTIANLRHVPYRDLPTLCGLTPDVDSPIECLFMAIRVDDTPQNHPVASIVAAWLREWLAAHSAPAMDAAR